MSRKRKSTRVKLSDRKKVRRVDLQPEHPPRAKKAAKLNERRRKFVEHYMATGNATESARRAGYRCLTDSVAAVTGSRLLRNANVQAELLKRQRGDTAVMTREDRLRWWTRVVQGSEPGMDNPFARTKCSEYLAKAGNDFVERKEINVKVSDAHRRLSDLVGEIVADGETGEVDRVTH